MKTTLNESIVVTGVGMVTPLGSDCRVVWERMLAGNSARQLTGFEDGVFSCPCRAVVEGFDVRAYLSEPKLARLMNRDAQFATAAARLALEDAGLRSRSVYEPEEIGLFGATGLAGLPMKEVTPLLLASTAADGKFDGSVFGTDGFKAVSPILSFKILSNMPLCFVAINECIKGANAIYTPWEGQGAQAIEAGILALRTGDARCVLVGACDVKTHELAFASLEQQGVFAGWRNRGGGGFPGEGAAFVVLETDSGAKARDARVYGRVGGYQLRSHGAGRSLAETRASVLAGLKLSSRPGAILTSATAEKDQEDEHFFHSAGLKPEKVFSPKRHTGDLFAAAGVLQLGLGALLVSHLEKPVVAACFGHGSEQAAFVLNPK